VEAAGTGRRASKNIPIKLVVDLGFYHRVCCIKKFLYNSVKPFFNLLKLHALNNIIILIFKD
jgi:hypothetical protein